MALNKVFIQGLLAHDPKSKRRNGPTEFSVAVRKRVSSKGTFINETSYIDCTAWGGTGEAIQRNFHKGSPIVVEGELKQESWSGAGNVSKSRIVVNVTTFHFTPGVGSAEGVRGDPRGEFHEVEAKDFGIGPLDRSLDRELEII